MRSKLTAWLISDRQPSLLGLLSTSVGDHCDALALGVVLGLAGSLLLHPLTVLERLDHHPRRLQDLWPRHIPDTCTNY